LKKSERESVASLVVLSGRRDMLVRFGGLERSWSHTGLRGQSASVYEKAVRAWHGNLPSSQEGDCLWGIRVSDPDPSVLFS
jgi:hypothetical protein